jgi:hypothetical protein
MDLEQVGDELDDGDPLPEWLGDAVYEGGGLRSGERGRKQTWIDLRGDRSRDPTLRDQRLLGVVGTSQHLGLFSGEGRYPVVHWSVVTARGDLRVVDAGPFLVSNAGDWLVCGYCCGSTVWA